jgi:RNA polymerase sigma-70 factor, ECF subfamily
MSGQSVDWTCSDADMEERLALEAQRGSRDALERLWLRYEPRIAQLCRVLSASDSEAADLTQETFLRVHEGIARYDPRRPFRFWLYALARNGVIDHLRRRGKWWDIERDLAGLRDEEAAPADPALRGESEERLRQAVRRLPEPYRLVVLYTTWADLSPSEIGELLEVPAGRVRVHLFRALRMLEKELRDR